MNLRSERTIAHW